MYDDARKYRSSMKSKAEKMAAGSSGKVDSSDWTPAEPANMDVQTGERPVSRRQYKSGGAVSGDFAQMRADRKPRASGGSANSWINRDVKAANEERDGTKHVGGFASGGNVGDTVPTSRLAFTGGESRLSKAAGLKTGGSVDGSVSGTPIKGGRTPRATGGGVGKDAKGHGSNGSNPNIPPLKPHEGSWVVTHRETGKPAGEFFRDSKAIHKVNFDKYKATPVGEHLASLNKRDGRKDGGRTKGKMNVNIIIGQPGAQNAPTPTPVPAPPPMAGPMHPPVPPPQMPPPGAGAPPPMPMARKSGGRTYYAGAGSGEGRLEKIGLYGSKAR